MGNTAKTLPARKGIKEYEYKKGIKLTGSSFENKIKNGPDSLQAFLGKHLYDIAEDGTLVVCKILESSNVGSKLTKLQSILEKYKNSMAINDKSETLFDQLLMSEKLRVKEMTNNGAYLVSKTMPKDFLLKAEKEAVQEAVQEYTHKFAKELKGENAKLSQDQQDKLSKFFNEVLTSAYLDHRNAAAKENYEFLRQVDTDFLNKALLNEDGSFSLLSVLEKLDLQDRSDFLAFVPLDAENGQALFEEIMQSPVLSNDKEVVHKFTEKGFLLSYEQSLITNASHIYANKLFNALYAHHTGDRAIEYKEGFAKFFNSLLTEIYSDFRKSLPAQENPSLANISNVELLEKFIWASNEVLGSSKNDSKFVSFAWNNITRYSNLLSLATKKGSSDIVARESEKAGKYQEEKFSLCKEELGKLFSSLESTIAGATEERLAQIKKFADLLDIVKAEGAAQYAYFEDLKIRDASFALNLFKVAKDLEVEQAPLESIRAAVIVACGGKMPEEVSLFASIKAEDATAESKLDTVLPLDEEGKVDSHAEIEVSGKVVDTTVVGDGLVL